MNFLNRNKVLFAGSSPHGTYRVVDTVYDGRPARVLYGTNNSPQSGVAQDENPELLFDYNQRFLEIIKSTQPKRILVIGGGAFMLPIAARRLFSELIVDVVEIDKLLVDISRDFFDLPEEPKLRVHIADGIDYLTTTKQRYDMIIVDAFSGYDIPPSLLEPVAIELYHRHIVDGGIVALNFISEYKAHRRRLAHTIIDRFSRAFPHLLMVQSDPDFPKGKEQNFVLAASDSEFRLDYLQSEALELF